MKRIFLFLATNIAVLVVLSVIINVFGLGNFLTAEGIDPVGLLAFSAVVGFAGSIISLLISKPMAKASTGARVIDGSEGTTEYWLVQTVQKLAQQANIGMPEVDGYEFIRRVRASTDPRYRDLPAIALTAFARSEDRSRALLAGYYVHVAKPIEPTELLATVASVAKRRRT